jgi:hypothetical protein
VSAPVPLAPDGYKPPIWRDDTIDALVVINRAGFGPLSDGAPTDHIDRFARDLAHELQNLMNVATHLVTTDEVRFEEDLPSQIYAVVTNDSAYAEWCREWNGNLVEVALDGEAIVLSTRDGSQRFDPDELASAVRRATEAVQFRPDRDGPLDTGPALLEPVTQRELAGLEPILAELWRAIGDEDLAEVHRVQIIAMAELLKAQQVAATPGITERWKLVGPIRAALAYLLKEVPKDVLAWWKLIELLQKIDWNTVAHHLHA